MKGPAISAIILAGGQARRMGGTDKAMQMLGSKPLIGWVLERLRPQVEEILINTNQKNPAYQDWGLTLFRDEISGFVGPLAGLHQGLQCAQHELVATVPCDSPFLPLDLIARLYQGLVQEEAQLAVVMVLRRQQARARGRRPIRGQGQTEHPHQRAHRPRRPPPRHR